MKIFKIGLVCIFVFSISCFSKDKLTSEEIYAKCMNSIVEIYCYDLNKIALNSGTGTIVSAEGLLYTNYHVVEGAASIQVRIGLDKFNDVPLVSFDPFVDLAVLQLPCGNYSPLQISAEPIPSLGSTIYAFGNPENLAKTLSSGILSSIQVNEYQMLYQISAPISHGSSGGALLNQFGELIGITSSMYPTGQNLNFALPISYFTNAAVIDKSDTSQVSLLMNMVKLHSNSVRLDFDEMSSIIYTYSNLYQCESAKWGFEGRFYKNQGFYDSAVICFSRAIAFTSDDNSLYGLRADCYSQLSDTINALLDYEKSISLCNNSTEGYISRAAFYHYTLKDYEKALEDYRRVIDLNPSNYYVFTRTADCKLKLGDKMGAINELNNSLQWNSNDPAIFNLRAEILVMLGKYEEAVESYASSLERQPSQIDLYLSRALLYSKIEDNTSAIQDYMEFIKFDPDDSEAYNNLAYCYLREKNDILAEQYFNQAIKIDKRNLKSYIGLAILYFNNGKTKSTVQYICKAIEMDDILYHGLPGIETFEHSGWFWNRSEKESIKKVFKLMNIEDINLEPVKDPRNKTRSVKTIRAESSN